ncbi:hypothetical protein GZL_05951 [Streptomyces sp. 769]|nr:hypothetical protein GZL_05951 [Streptomyces sp. 769]
MISTVRTMRGDPLIERLIDRRAGGRIVRPTSPTPTPTAKAV